MKLNDKYIKTIRSINELSVINMIYILSFCFTVLGLTFMYQGHKVSPFIGLFYGIAFLYLTFKIKKSNENFDYAFYIAFFLLLGFFDFFLMFNYYIGENIERNKRFFYFSWVPHMMLRNRIFENKCNYIYLMSIYSLNFYVLFALYYILYGSNEFWLSFDMIDFLYTLFIVLNTFSGFYSKTSFLKEYNLLLWENNFNIEKFNSLFKNQATPIIRIDTNHNMIECNDIFYDFLKKVISFDQQKRYFSSSGSQMSLPEEDRLSNEFKNFIESYKNYKENSINQLNIGKFTKFNSNGVFYEHLYIFGKILNGFKRSSNSVQTQSKNLYEDIFYMSKFFDNNETFKTVGNFINNSEVSNLTSFEMQFRKSIIQNAEIVDIIFYDTSAVTKMEKEKLETKNKYRKEHLSLISDKFITPIQVLIHTINTISLEFEIKKAKKPTKFIEVENLGFYIYTLNQDIQSYLGKDTDYDVLFNKFPAEELFYFGYQVLNLLIKYDSTKCHAIETDLVIDPQIPKTINSDINRLKQVLANYINNASKFTLTGKITISAKLEESNDIFDEIIVYIEDTGRGIQPELRDSLFKDIEINTDDNFISSKKGYGLIICRNIINRIGRKIGYIPKEHGSIFYFTFLNIKVKNLELNINKDNTFKINKFLDDNFISKGIQFQNSSLSEILKEVSFSPKKDLKNPLLSFMHIIPTVNTNKEAKSSTSNLIFSPNTRRERKSEKSDLFDEFLCTFRNVQNDSNSKYYINNYIDLIDFIEFNDSVFNYYKIKDDDSILKQDKPDSYRFSEENLILEVLNKETNYATVTNVKHSKFLALLKEISIISDKFYDDTFFLKIKENFKSYLRFFSQSLKIFENIDCMLKIKRILLVDDNKLILKALKKIVNEVISDLNLSEYLQVLTAYDGVDALAIFKMDHYTSQSINLIITDHNMSMMTGGEFIKLVDRYREGRDIKLYISSTDNDTLKNNKMKNVSFLSKPARKSELSKIIEELV